MKQPHGIRAAANAGNERIGRTPSRLQHLGAGFVADHLLEVAYHHRVGMRPGDGADTVEGVGDIGDPIAQRLVHRILERLRPRFNRTHLGAERLHAQHVWLLPLDVDHAHIDDAFETEFRAHRRGGNPMHAGPGLGDDARFAHAAGQQDLTEHVVDLVRAGVIEVLALEIDFCAAATARSGDAAKMLGHALGEVERRGAPDVILEVTVHLAAEAGIVLRLGVGRLQLKNERHQRLGDEASAIETEMPALVGSGTERIELLDAHALLAACSGSFLTTARAAAIKARILSGSFSPGARSTPEDTSTPGAAVMRSACATFSASSPPESMKGTRVCTFSSSRQSKRRPSPPGRVASTSARASKISRSATAS